MKTRLLLALIVFCFSSMEIVRALEPGIRFDPRSASQGKTLVVYVDPEETFDEAQASFLGQKIRFYFIEGKFRGLVGIPPDQKPGKYLLRVSVAREGGTPREISQWIEVRPTRFASTWFRLKPAKKKLYVRDLIQKEWAKIERALLVERPDQGWEGVFALPVDGPFSMTFGTVEHINGKRTGQHRGLDIAVPIGTKVKAAASGRVVFSDVLKAFGGTVVIDHGQGVHTLYFHLSKLLKGVGQGVEGKEVIALSGNSGISSGPHLHWGFSVHDVRVDPLQWTKTEL